MGANGPHTPQGAAILFATFGHTGFAFRQIIHEGERKFGRIGSVETFIPENGAPLAPTLPPRGRGRMRCLRTTCTGHSRQ